MKNGTKMCAAVLRSSAVVQFFVLIFSNGTMATELKSAQPIDAQISGETYLGLAGKKITIIFKKEKCELNSIGENGTDGTPPKSFQIIFSCGNKKQILWDILKPAAGDYNFDEPKFELIWSGDQDGDGDGKIDLKMNLSPKYSCSKEVLYLSSKAKPDDLVRINGTPQTICGE